VALAGVAQCARIVDQISRTGSYPPEFLHASLHSLFVFDSGEVAEVYGGLAGVKLGLQALNTMLGDRAGEEARNTTRYVFSLLYLERRFAADAAMMNVVRSRLEHARFRSEHFTDNPTSICHSVSAIYQDTLSRLRFRIKVTGNAQYLQDERNADTIRACLLAGIRSAFLWRQLGGRRWKLLFQRRRLQRISDRLSQGVDVV